MATRVKICGVTTVAAAAEVAGLGADFVGVNLVPSSPRAVPRETAVAIARELRTAVAVVADASDDEIRALVDDGFHAVQLHGARAAEQARRLGEPTFAAFAIGSADDVETARAGTSARLLVDARVPGALGGTGVSFDWALVRDLAVERELWLAGGLRPDNVARAVEVVRPAVVDVASGVEQPGRPGQKDPTLVTAFIQAVRGAG